jgi:hypothetical protein
MDPQFLLGHLSLKDLGFLECLVFLEAPNFLTVLDYRLHLEALMFPKVRQYLEHLKFLTVLDYQ